MMRRYRSPLMATLLLVLVGCSVLDPNNIIGRQRVAGPVSDVPVPVKDDRWRERALDEVWNTINDRYYDAALNGVDWKAIRANHAPRILAAASDDEYWELLDKMTGELRDSHTRVHGPKLVAQLRDQEAHSLGLGFLELDGSLVVTSVHAESDAWWAGVRPGMLVKTIDGAPALSRYHALVTEVRDSSTPWARTRSAMRKILAGDIDSKVAMTFARQDGSEITAPLKRRRFHTPPETVARILPSGFAYVRFSNFVEALEGGLLRAIDEMKDAPGMIVDLRNNGGGSLLMANKLTAKFLTAETPGPRTLTRDGKPITVAFFPVIKPQTTLFGDKARAYTRPLAILTNENSASASEIFSGTLRDLGRAMLIGQRSCGCMLGYLGYADLSGGGQLAYSEMGFILPKGERIEGKGLMPDVEIKLTREDIAAGRDRTLEAAEAFLKEKTKA